MPPASNRHSCATTAAVAGTGPGPPRPHASPGQHRWTAGNAHLGPDTEHAAGVRHGSCPHPATPAGDLPGRPIRQRALTDGHNPGTGPPSRPALRGRGWQIGVRRTATPAAEQAGRCGRGPAAPGLRLLPAWSSPQPVRRCRRAPRAGRVRAPDRRGCPG